MQLKIESQTWSLKMFACHSRASCLTRTRHGLIFHICQFFHNASLPLLLRCLLYPSHGDDLPPDPRTAGRFGCLAVQSPLTGYEPHAIVEIRREVPFTDLQGQVFDQTIPARTRQIHLERERDKASEGQLHRCSCRNEKQVQSRHGFITLVPFISHSERRETWFKFGNYKRERE